MSEDIGVPACAAPRTPRLQQLLQLREMLSKATGPDVDLDCYIHAAMENATYEPQSGGRSAFHRGGSWVPLGTVHRYTASIDAAVTLVPADTWRETNGPRRSINIPSPVQNFWHTYITVWSVRQDFHGWGATEPLSICLARVNYELSLLDAAGARRGSSLSSASA